MEQIKKIILISIIITGILSIFSTNISNAGIVTDTIKLVDRDIKEPESQKYSKLNVIIGKLLGFLQVSSGLVTVLTIAFTGFNYILTTDSNVKSDMKKKGAPIIVGMVMVFGAVSIAKFVMAIV